MKTRELTSATNIVSSQCLTSPVADRRKRAACHDRRFCLLGTRAIAGTQIRYYRRQQREGPLPQENYAHSGANIGILLAATVEVALERLKRVEVVPRPLMGVRLPDS